MTHKQAELLKFIKTYIQQHGGVPPSYREMASAINLQSVSGISRMIDGLIERGKLRKLTARARSLEVL